MPDSRLLLGVIGRAHGVRGRVRVTSYTADPDDLTAYGPLADDTGRQFVLRWTSDGIAEIAELRDGQEFPVRGRTEAEKLVNVRLYIDRSLLPPIEEEDEYYMADLVGLEAFDPGGAVLGKVTVVHDYGAGPSLEIEDADGKSLILPFTREIVPEVDIAGGRIVVAPPDELDVPNFEPAAPAEGAA